MFNGEIYLYTEVVGLWKRIKSGPIVESIEALVKMENEKRKKHPFGWTPEDILNLGRDPDMRVPFLFLARAIIQMPMFSSFDATQKKTLYYLAAGGPHESENLVEHIFLVKFWAAFFYKWRRPTIKAKIHDESPVVDLRLLWTRLQEMGDGRQWREIRLNLISNTVYADFGCPNWKKSATFFDEDLMFNQVIPFVLQEYELDPPSPFASFSMSRIIQFFRSAQIPLAQMEVITNLVLSGLTFRASNFKSDHQESVLFVALNLAKFLFSWHRKHIPDRRITEMKVLASMLRFVCAKKFPITQLSAEATEKIPLGTDWTDVIEVGPDMEDRPYAIGAEGRMSATPEEFADLMRLGRRTRITVINLFRAYNGSWSFDSKMWPINAFLHEAAVGTHSANIQEQD